MQLVNKVLLGAVAACAIAQGQRVAAAGQQPDPTTTPQPSAQPLPTDPQPDPGAQPSTDPSNPSTDPSTDPSSTDPSTDPHAQVPPSDPSTDTTAVAPASEGNVEMADTSDDRFGYAWREDGLRTGIGVSAILGGGVSGFTDQTMRSTTSDVGGLWNLRVTIGSHIPLGVDLSYIGTATDIPMPAGQSATLIGTTAEAALRFNILPHYEWNPYVFAGAGWQRYDVTKSSGTMQLAGMRDSDDLIEFPMGTGVQYRRAGFVADLRGTFRATTEENLVPRTPGDDGDDEFVPMHTWEASAALGYEF